MSTITGVTTADVSAYTGVTVTDDEVSQALSVIELYASVDLSNFAGFRATNRKWLQMAVAYQAAWMHSQPDLFSRTDFTNQSQDGLSVSTRDASTLMVAPLAKKALSRVSWVRPRSIYIAPGRHMDRYNGGSLNTYPGRPYTDADWSNGNDDPNTVGGWLPVDWN